MIKANNIIATYKQKALVLRGSFFNIGLRGLILCSKFVLLVYLAKIFSPKEIGILGLMTTTLTYSLYVIGFDFYTYSTRELLAKPQQLWPVIIRDQFVFSIIIYVLVAPLLVVVFFFKTLPWEFFGWFYLLLALEYISQEVYRLFVAVQRPIIATFILFLRSASWAYALIFLMYFFPETRSLTSVWLVWFLGVGLSVLLGIFLLREMDWHVVWGTPVNWGWIKRGVCVGGRFFLGTIALRGIFTFDRYVLDWYCDKEMVGVYSFYMAMANSIQSLLDAGVFVYYYPKLITCFQKGLILEYRQNLISMLKSTCFFLLVSVISLFIFIDPLLSLLNKPIYSDNISVFWILVFAMVIYCVGMVPHYGLYSKRRDIQIVYTTIFAFVGCMISLFVLVPSLGHIGAALSVLISVSLLSLGKLFVFIRDNKRLRFGE